MLNFLLYLHIFSVVLSIGPFFVLIPMLSKMKSVDQLQLGAYIDSFRFVVRLSKHAGHLLVISGLLLMWAEQLSWKTSWIASTIVILGSTLFFIARAFSPALQKLQSEPHNRLPHINKLSRSLALYLLILLFLMWLMVAKPIWW